MTLRHIRPIGTTGRVWMISARRLPKSKFEFVEGGGEVVSYTQNPFRFLACDSIQVLSGVCAGPAVSALA